MRANTAAAFHSLSLRKHVRQRHLLFLVFTSCSSGNPDELYRSMEMVKSTVHKVDMSWSHKGSLERRNSAAPHSQVKLKVSLASSLLTRSQWVYEGVFDAPSKDVNGKLDIQKKGSTWTISNKVDG